eukprot:CAMPEP_0179048176 /NCGR_PEP_ID=MMETSP0796-20121207/19577_1 /TAXON_ID=73915 /ORGANISM="Pyrodinium bahamense, Strain pbaha01" /LENGTH=427 /DNA_ID=CAMNT_0020744643 /DNA_START=23 /DNA_END=1306 /DNA_ORIENTATION=+
MNRQLRAQSLTGRAPQARHQGLKVAAQHRAALMAAAWTLWQPAARHRGLQLRQLLASLLALWLAACSAQHATYRFATEQSDFESLTVYLRFQHIEAGDAYVATKFFTGCSIGKFGGQVHIDGTHGLVIALWDYDGMDNSARGASPWCSRFSQGEGKVWPAGTGAKCLLPFQFQSGSEYRFRLTKSKSPGGIIWTLDVRTGDTTTIVGSIFVSQLGDGRDCSLLEPEAESSMEYYTGGTFHTEASCRGPYLGGDHGLAPTDVDVDCGAGSMDGELIPAEVSSKGAQNSSSGGGRGLRMGVSGARFGGTVPLLEGRPFSMLEMGFQWLRPAVGSSRPAVFESMFGIGFVATLLAAGVAAIAYSRRLTALERAEALAAEGDEKQGAALLSGSSCASQASHRSGMSSYAESYHTNPTQSWIEAHGHKLAPR